MKVLANNITNKRLQKELKNILKQLKKFNMKKAILFGSLARGEAGITSDIDLIVILESDRPFHKRLKELYKEIDYHEPLNLLAYTLGDLCKSCHSTNVILSDLRRGRILRVGQGHALTIHAGQGVTLTYPPQNDTL